MKESYDKVMNELGLFHGLSLMLGHQYCSPAKNKFRDLLKEFKEMILLYQINLFEYKSMIKIYKD